MIKKLLKTGVLALIWSLNSLGQNPGWILAPNKLIFSQIGSPSTSALPIPQFVYDNPNTPALGYNPTIPLNDGGYNGQVSEYASNMITTPSGEIEFFIIDSYIFDKSGHFIDQLFLNTGGATGTSEITVIPFPGDCKKYYILSTVKQSGSFQKTPYLFILDMGENNFYADGNTPNPEDYYGALSFIPGTSSKSISISDLTGGIYDYADPGYGKKSNVFFAATKEKSNGSRLAFITNGAGIYVFNVSTSGFTYTHMISFSNNDNFNPFDVRSELEIAELSSGNYRIAAPFNASLSGKYQGLYTAELTSSGIPVSGSIKYFYTDYFNPTGINESARYRGVEFSENGNILYVTHTTNSLSANSLEYYDFSNPTSTLNPITLPSPLSQDVFQYSLIERGALNKLYLANGNGLYTLADMNNPASAITHSSSFSYSSNHEGEPNPNTLELYSLPDQIDGMDYDALFNDNLQCCIDSRSYDITEYSANSGTWNGLSPLGSGSTITVKKELRIPAGVSLTINNMLLKFAPGARLVVENGTGGSQGGKLILNGTTLTVDDRCSMDAMWLGVEVWGNSTASQGSVLNSSQGVFRMYDSKIEHAQIGVLVSRRNESNGVPIPNSSYNNSRNGGVFISNNDTIFNCWAGVLFQSYNIGSTNLSRINSSDFIWDGLLKDNSKKPSMHIGIFQCTKIYITASNFYQETPNLYSNKNEWGMGILAFNSDFSVTSSCSTLMPLGQDCSNANTIPSKFKNLKVGVSVINGNGKPFSVIRNEFTNCLNGVYSSSATNQKISRNTFEIHEDNNIQTWGIFVNHGNLYEITENHLMSLNGGIANTYGIIIDNSGPTHNEVYKNVFKELYVGTQAQRINGAVYVPGPNNNAGGLRYNCNTFKGPIQIADIAVAVNSRIDYEQGRVGGLTENEARNVNTARNVFSYTGSGAYDILLSPGSHQVNYHHLKDSGHKPMVYTSNPPIAVYPIQQTWGLIQLYADNKTCLTKYPASWPPFVVINFPFAKLATIDSLYNVIDGGKTEYLLNLIASSPNSTSTYNELMSASPYLSDQVLINYTNSSTSDNNLKGVLVDNSKLSDTVWNVFNNSSRPNSVKNYVGWYQGGISDMSILYDKIRSFEYELHDQQQAFISSILEDTLMVSKTDSLIKYLELSRGEDFSKNLLSLYSSNQNHTKFDSVLTKLKVSNSLGKFYNLRYSLDSNADWSESVKNDSTIIADLEGLTNDENFEVSSLALATLKILNGEPMDYDILPLDSKSKSMMFNSEPEKESNKEVGNKFIIYPNPSEGVVYINFSEIESQVATVQLFDLSGKEVYSTQFLNSTKGEIDLSKLKKGTYLIKVVIDGNLSENQLFVLE